MTTPTPDRFRNFSTSEANFIYNKEEYTASLYYDGHVFHDVGYALTDAIAEAQKGIVLSADISFDQYTPATRLHLEHMLRTLDMLRFGSSCVGFQDTGFFKVGSKYFLGAPKQPRDVQQIIDEFVSEFKYKPAEIATWRGTLNSLSKYLFSRGAKSEVVENIVQTLPTTLNDEDLRGFSIAFDYAAGGPEIRIFYGLREWFFDARTGSQTYQTNSEGGTCNL